MTLPNPLPRPPDELSRLRAVWAPPRGWRFLSAVNNTHIGLFYIAAALLFFVVGGGLALLVRAQLAVPGNTVLGPGTYNQVFTRHGSGVLAVLLRALRPRPGSGGGAGRSPTDGLGPGITIVTSLLALIAILWQGLAMLSLPPCR